LVGRTVEAPSLIGLRSVASAEDTDGVLTIFPIGVDRVFRRRRAFRRGDLTLNTQATAGAPFYVPSESLTARLIEHEPVRVRVPVRVVSG
jgi:hypothetical protein